MVSHRFLVTAYSTLGFSHLVEVGKTLHMEAYFQNLHNMPTDKWYVDPKAESASALYGNFEKLALQITNSNSNSNCCLFLLIHTGTTIGYRKVKKQKHF
jgi:hypothetical protein